MRNAEVTVDASPAVLAALHVTALGSIRLQIGVPSVLMVTITALGRIRFLHPRPYAHGKLVPMRLELLLRVDHAGEMAPQFERGTHLPRHHRSRRARDMAIGADRTDPSAILVVDGVLEFGVDVVPHLVARNAETLGVGRFKDRVEAAPENDTRSEHQYAAYRYPQQVPFVMLAP